jgi:hypothetical protein
MYDYSEKRMWLSSFLSFIIHRSFDFVFQENFIIHRVLNLSIYVIIHVVKISIIKHYVNTSNDVRHNIKSIDFEISEISEHFFLLIVQFDHFVYFIRHIFISKIFYIQQNIAVILRFVFIISSLWISNRQNT